MFGKITRVCAKFGIPNSPQSPDIGQNSDGGIFKFWISGQSLKNKTCHNSRTMNDINIKLWIVTKLDKKTMATARKPEGDVMSENCDIILF